MLRAPHAFATDLTAAQVLGVPIPEDPVTYLGIRRGDPRIRAWIVLVITAVDVYQRPAPTLMRIVSALSRRGCPDLPQRLDDDWRRL